MIGNWLYKKLVKPPRRMAVDDDHPMWIKQGVEILIDGNKYEVVRYDQDMKSALVINPMFGKRECEMHRLVVFGEIEVRWL